MKKDFILGVGCQKGGTTWLRSQLRKSSNVDMGFAQEYHVFDALYVPEFQGFLHRKLKRLQDASRDLARSPRINSQLLRHVGFYLDVQNYYDYFNCLWCLGGENITTVGDVTPSYSCLPAEALREIKAGLEGRGFNVKVIFLMRDPIERIWSMVRMNRRNLFKKNPDDRLPDESKSLERKYQSRDCEMRTKYEVTVRNLDGVFDSDNVFYGFYEELFEDHTIARLKEFLGLDDLVLDTNEKVNVSEKSELLPELDGVLASRIFDHYRGTYEFCQQRFGVKDLWAGWGYA